MLLRFHETFIKSKLADEPEDIQIIKMAGAIVWGFLRSVAMMENVDLFFVELK